MRRSMNDTRPTSSLAASRPNSVRLYSTRGGTSGYATRVIRPSCSSVRRVWLSIFSLTPSTRRRSSLNRYVRSRSAARTSTPHLLVTCSRTARVGQSRVYTSNSTPAPLSLILTVAIYLKVGTSQSKARFLGSGVHHPNTVQELAMATPEQHKAVVLDYYRTAFAGEPERAVREHFGPVYIQHTPQAAA